MNIRIPRRIVTAWDAFVEWGDIPVFSFKRFTLRRIDIVIVIGCVFCTSYYSFYGGWLGALTGFLAFTLVALIASWLV